MLRALFLFTLGVFGGAVFTAAISVYLLHDVDKNMAGKWNEAFLGLCFEFFFFALLIGIGVTLLVALVRSILRFNGHDLWGCDFRSRMSLLLGLGVAIIQYPFEFLGRIAIPQFEGAVLSFYMIAAVVLSSAVIVRDSYREMKMRQDYLAGMTGISRG
jgi:hypothetical protein